MSMLECKSCHAPVGDEAKVMPFRCDDGDGKWETFCPQCFVHVRAPLEPERFSGEFTAVRCLCGTESVVSGTLRCQACGRRTALLVLGPKGPPKADPASE